MMRSALLRFFSHRTLALVRWDLHLLQVRSRYFINRRKLMSRLARTSAPVYLNLGCGSCGLNDRHWINVDAFSGSNVHAVYDIARPLPLPNGCLDGVFCQHVLEHFTLTDGERISAEVARMLKTTGVFRVIVPDAALIVREFLDAPNVLAQRRQCQTAAEALDLYFRQRYEHQFLYDWPTMRAMLLRAGFSSVERASFRGSRLDSDFAIDHPSYEADSLYVEAIR